MHLNTKCTHSETTFGENRCFVASVATSEDHVNRAAHGSVTYTETCCRCGAERHVNSNQSHVETGPWGPGNGASNLD